MSQTRRIAAILAADCGGLPRLIGADEGGTLQGFRAARAELTDAKIKERRGRLVKTTIAGQTRRCPDTVNVLAGSYSP